MSDSNEKDQGTYSSCDTKKEQRVYIKIKYLNDNTGPIITVKRGDFESPEHRHI